MNILFVSPPPYLPNRLHRMRSFLLIQTLARKHNIHLVALTTEKKIPQEFSEIQTLCKTTRIIRIDKNQAMLNCIRYPLLPSEAAYCISSKTKNVIANLIQKNNIDLIYMKRLRSIVLAPDTEIPLIIDTTDAMSMFYHRMFLSSNNLMKKFFYFLEYKRYKSFEKFCMKRFSHWVICSDADKKYLKKMKESRKARIDVIPNPVDTDYFKPKKSKVKFDLLFRGLLDKPVNIDAALFLIKEVFPIIKQKFPKITLCIAGLNPIEKIRKFDDEKNIFVRANVESMPDIIASTKITLCTVRVGAGTRFKILQSWAMQKPVISTTLGAEGLSFKDKKNILIANTPMQIANSVSNLLRKPSLYKNISRNGYNLAQKNYGLQALEKHLEEILQSYKK